MQDRWTEVEPRIREAVELLDSERTSHYKKIPLYGSIIALVMLLFGCCIFGFSFPMLLGCLAIGWGIMFAVYSSQQNESYKQKVMPTLVEAVCSGATYHPEGTITEEVIKSSRLYNMGWGEKFKNEDTIRGQVGKTDFVYGEVELWHMQQTGKTAVKVVDFKGFVFEADFNKYFQGITLLSSEKFKLSGQLGFFSGLDRCKLEDVRFEDRYKTYTSNDQEARYILTPALQERIMNMNDVFAQQLRDKELSISFHDDRMLIMVPSSTDRFEAKYDIESVKKDFLALALMIDIVEQLNLNLRIWTKE